MSIKKRSIIAVVATAAIAGPTASASACLPAVQGWLAHQQTLDNTREIAHVQASHAKPARFRFPT